MTPRPLERAERLSLLLAEDRARRAFGLGLLFLVLGVLGVAMGLGGRPDGWYPFLGVPFVMIGAIAYIWSRARCPRCGRRVLIGRRRLPETCPRCGVRLLRPPDESDTRSTGIVSAEPRDDPRSSAEDRPAAG